MQPVAEQQPLAEDATSCAGLSQIDGLQSEYHIRGKQPQHSCHHLRPATGCTGQRPHLRHPDLTGTCGHAHHRHAVPRGASCQRPCPCTPSGELTAYCAQHAGCQLQYKSHLSLPGCSAQHVAWHGSDHITCASCAEPLHLQRSSSAWRAANCGVSQQLLNRAFVLPADAPAQVLAASFLLPTGSS